MSELKALLKEATKLIVGGKNEEAMKMCEDAIKEGAQDYMLFCLAALANSNVDYSGDAAELYIQAIKVDSAKPTAWQGLFKLYDTDQLDIDERAVEACEKVIAFSDTPEKKENAKKRRREYLFKLRKYAELKEDIGTDSILHREIVDLISKKEMKSETEKQLLSTAFEALSQSFGEDGNLHFLFLQFFIQSKPYLEWVEELGKYTKSHGADQEFVVDRIEEALCIDFLESGVLDEDLFELYEGKRDEENTLYTLLDTLAEDDRVEASKIIDCLGESSIVVRPLVYLAIRILYEDEAYERSLRIIGRLSTSNDDDQHVTALLRGFKAKSLFAMGDASSRQAAFTLLPLADIFRFDEALIRMSSGADVTTIVSGLSEEEKTRITLSSAIRSRNVSEKDVEVARTLVTSDDFLDLILSAEILLFGEQDATAVLVRAAKVNPRSSRVFYLLARALRSKNRVKARSCADRAVKIRPVNEEYVHLLDDMLLEDGGSHDVRLPILLKLPTSSKPLWLRRRLPALLMAAGKRDAAVDELQQLLRINADDWHSWAELASAYAQRGNLQAAVNAYEKVLELHPESDYAVPMIQVLLRLGQLDSVVEHCVQWRQSRDNQLPRGHAHFAIDLLEVQGRLKRALQMMGEECLDEFHQIFSLLAPILEEKPAFSLPYKLAGDALLYCAGFNEEVFGKITFPASLECSSVDACSLRACSLFTSALSLNREQASVWADLAVSLVKRSEMSGKQNKEYAEKAIVCLRQAIRLSANCAPSKSLYWTMLADAYRMNGESPEKQQHCLIRALQLNKANDQAWCRLGVLYSRFVTPKVSPPFEAQEDLDAEDMEMNRSGRHAKRDQANTALETAVKINPDLAEAWTCWAINAHKDNVGDAYQMFIQALTYKGTEASVQHLVEYLCNLTTSFDPSASLIQFEKILAVYARSRRTPSFVLALGVLSEFFGHYADAVRLLSTLDTAEARTHLQRAQLKAGMPVSTVDPRLTRLQTLATTSSDDLCANIQSLAVYGDLFSRLVSGEEILEYCRENMKKISIPLVVAAILRFSMDVPEASVRALHDLRPRHELIDVWPTEVPEDLDNEMNYLEQDGEEPFRFRHCIAKPLFDQLSILRQEWNETKLANGESTVATESTVTTESTVATEVSVA